MKFAKKDELRGWGIVIPITLYYAVFTLVPLGMLLYFSLRNYNVIQNKNDWVGLQNYIDIFKYSEYFYSIAVTLFIAVFVVLIGMVLGFILAHYLMKVSRGRGMLRILWYLPVLLPLATIAKWLDILLKPEGTLNNLAAVFGAGPVSWFRSAFWMYFFIILTVTWKGLGSTALYFMAGMAGIDKEIYEAADIDGARRLTRIFHITLPLMRPMLGFILITGFIGAFNLFEPVLLISKGGPDGKTKVILYKIYDEAFKNNKLGFSCALSVVVFILVLILTLINAKISDDSLLKG